MSGEPVPSSAAVSRAMSSQRVRDTGPEKLLRSELHQRGLRYRVHQRPLPEVRRTVDIVFRSARVAVEVRGCFWHGCPDHATWPKANAEWWAAKIMRNRERDQDTEKILQSKGWELVVVWEHDDVLEAAQRIETLVHRRR